MALGYPTVMAVVIMLDAKPELTGALNIHSVPVVFVQQTRYDGPINEWVLAEHIRRIACQDGPAP
jgi:hypothetical protein